MGKEEDYKEMFVAEAMESYEELNRLFTVLEKDIHNKQASNHIFRITHTLKGNAMGMGRNKIADLAHVMEDVFGAIKAGTIVLDEDLFNNLYKANDKLGLLIESVTSGEKVSYKGIRTKLSVFLKNARKESENEAAPTQPEQETPVVQPEQKAPVTQTEQEAPAAQPAPVQEAPKSETESASTTEQQVGEAESVEEEEEVEEDDVPRITMSDLVQVPVRKLDALMNLVGELIIERDSLVAKNAEYGLSTNMFARLQRISSDLQYGVMDIRLVQVGFMFNKFHRIVRDVANIEQKKVQLKLEGTEIEIDRNILKIMSDSLIHLVRNSVSHGIESPEQRKQKGKSEEGVVTLSAKNEKDSVIIQISDDGNGINADAIARKAIKMGIASEEFVNQISESEKIKLIFEPGFSNMDQITAVSGRGVGMDVVRKATESIGGNVEVETALGKGSTFTLRLPSSMTVKGALLFELAGQEYAVALSYTEAVVSYKKKDLHRVSDGLMAYYLENTISVVFLKDLLQWTFNKQAYELDLLTTYNELQENEKLDVLIVSYNGKYLGIVVDKLLQQKEVLEKNLAPPLNQLDMINGATILGNGNVCLMIDIAGIVSYLSKDKENLKMEM